MSTYLAIYGCFSCNVIYVILQTSCVTPMNHYFAPTLFLSFLSLESWISNIGFCDVTLSPIATLILFLKMPLFSLSNIDHIDA